jgi:DNA (cytosine-5)-methyltransferase 1
MAQPAVDFWRGESISFPDARVLLDNDPALPSSLARALKQKGRRPTAIDLFSGAGGLSLGLEQAGFFVLMGADNDSAACETHANASDGVTVRTNLSKPARLLSAVDAAGINHVDLVAGGPPCQPFSRAGRSKISALERESGPRFDSRPRLWLSFMRFVRQLRPDVVLMENVPDLVCWEGGATIRAISSTLESEGYEVHARVLECWRFGVPQHRQRLFVVGTQVPGAFRFPDPDDTRITLADAIGDLPVVKPAQREYWLPLAEKPSTKFQRSMRVPWARKISDHITRDVRADDREAFKLLRNGVRYAELPRRLRRYRKDIFDDKYHVLTWNGLSRSITAHIAKDGYWYIHPRGDRMLSIREAARLQTFPDRFQFAGYPSDRLRQIGNAVPPEIARRLAERIAQSMDPSITAGNGLPFRATEFRRRLVAWHRRRSREYPWRLTTDPWLVLASEVLLRRTRADAVAAVWADFRKGFRRPRDVVNRPRELRRLLRPLGLRWRVENLIAIARHIVREGDGRVPRTREGLLELPGVGDYVADAVRAFAFGERAVLVDSNTARVASRVFGLPEKWSSLRNLDLRASVARLAGVRAPDPHVNLALLDLGGTVCLPRTPRCNECPVRALCRYALDRSGD